LNVGWARVTPSLPSYARCEFTVRVKWGLTFRGIASFSHLPWSSLACEVTGTVDRVNRVTQFTHLQVRARLRVPAGANEEQARRLLAKAEETCLVTRSLKATPHLEANVEFDTP